MCDKKKLDIDITFTAFEQVCKYLRVLEGASIGIFIACLLIYPLSLPALTEEHLSESLHYYTSAYLDKSLVKMLIIISNIVYIAIVMLRYKLYDPFQKAVNQQIERVHSDKLTGDPRDYADIGRLSRPLFFKKKRDFIYGFLISIFVLVSFLFAIQ